MKNNKINVAKIITDKIIERLEQGIVSWHKDWCGIPAYNYVTGKAYTGINRMMLEGGAYLTHKQLTDLGGKVKKGSKASKVVFYKVYEKTIKDVEMKNLKTEEVEVKDITEQKFCLKYSNAFHQSQIEGIVFEEKDITLHDHHEISDAQQVVDSYFANAGLELNISLGSDKAYYSPSRDRVVMPDMRQFASPESYYGTLYHEMVHSTGHKSRLNRDMTGRFRSKAYAREELIAEIGAAILNSTVGIDNEALFTNNVAYIQSWIGLLQNDSNLVIHAANRAEKAVNFIFDSNVRESDIAA